MPVSYCHGDNKHIATRLGNAAVAVGTDPIGGAIGSGTVCASCHNSTDNDYAAMMALLSPDPVFKSTGQNWNVNGTDHASYGTTDADCKSCHGGVLSGSADISEFVHNVDAGKSGGPDCISCHDLSGTAPKKVDVTVLQSSSHNNLNGASTESIKPVMHVMEMEMLRQADTLQIIRIQKHVQIAILEQDCIVRQQLLSTTRSARM